MMRNRVVFWVWVLLSLLHSTGVVFAQTPGPGCGWGDGFDGYALGSDPGGQGEWIGSGPVVTDSIASSPPHSVVFDDFDDLTSGPVVVRAQVYVPSNATGDLYFIMLNRFQVGGPKNWSVQLRMNPSPIPGFPTGVIEDVGGSPGGAPPGMSLPLVVNAWAEIRVEIDLDANLHSIFYEGSPTKTDEPWSGAMGSLLEIQAIDLFSNGSSEGYFDDVTVECPGQNDFIRGDANAEGSVNIADAVYILNALFTLGPPPPCDDSADTNDDGSLNISDAVYLLTNLFSNGPPPPAPYPACGPDPIPDALGCGQYTPCP